jgi:hypothetical protein
MKRVTTAINSGSYATLPDSHATKKIPQTRKKTDLETSDSEAEMIRAPNATNTTHTSTGRNPRRLEHTKNRATKQPENSNSPHAIRTKNRAAPRLRTEDHERPGGGKREFTMIGAAFAWRSLRASACGDRGRREGGGR